MTQQIPLRDWPTGLEEDALHLALDPAEITRRTEVAFDRGHDSLDDFEGAVIDLGGGVRFALQHHLHASVPGTTVLLEPDSSAGLKHVIRFLKLQRDDIVWAAPNLEPALKQVFGTPGKRAFKVAAKVTAAAAAAAWEEVRRLSSRPGRSKGNKKRA